MWCEEKLYYAVVLHIQKKLQASSQWTVVIMGVNSYDVPAQTKYTEATVVSSPSLLYICSGRQTLTDGNEMSSFLITKGAKWQCHELTIDTMLNLLNEYTDGHG